MALKKHIWGDNKPGFRCTECQLGWWGDTNELYLPECGSEEALKLAEWQLTEGRRKDQQTIEERLEEARNHD